MSVNCIYLCNFLSLKILTGKNRTNSQGNKIILAILPFINSKISQHGKNANV